MFVVCCVLFDVLNWSVLVVVVRWLRCDVCCSLLPVLCCVAVVVGWLLFADWCVLFVVRWSVFVFSCWLLWCVVCCSLSAVRCLWFAGCC